MFILFGESGSGKTSIATELIKLGYKRAITTTTRCPRPGEVNGRDYHFVSKYEMQNLFNNEKLLEMTKYDDDYYGMSIEEFQNSDFAIMEPIGILRYLSNNLKFIPIYVSVPGSIRLERLLSRGDSYSEVFKRMEQDFTRFKCVKDIPNVIEIDGAYSTPDVIANNILRIISNADSIVPSTIPVKVSLEYIFDYDTAYDNPKFVDIKGLAIDSAKRDLNERILNDPSLIDEVEFTILEKNISDDNTAFSIIE